MPFFGLAGIGRAVSLAQVGGWVSDDFGWAPYVSAIATASTYHTLRMHKTVQTRVVTDWYV